MTPHGSNPVASLHVDHSTGDGGMEATVASKISIIDVLDRVVRVGGPDSDK